MADWTQVARKSSFRRRVPDCVIGRRIALSRGTKQSGLAVVAHWIATRFRTRACIAGFVLMLRPVALSLMAVGLTHLASNICFGFSK